MAAETSIHAYEIFVPFACGMACAVMAVCAVDPFLDMNVMVHYEGLSWRNNPLRRVALKAAVVIYSFAHFIIHIYRLLVRFGEVAVDLNYEAGFLPQLAHKA